MAPGGVIRVSSRNVHKPLIEIPGSLPLHDHPNHGPSLYLDELQESISLTSGN
jgi:hypothetical protein